VIIAKNTESGKEKEMKQEQSKMTTEYGIDFTFVTFEDEKILEEAQIRELQKSLEPVIEKNKDSQLVLNFANVGFMTSAMLGLLVRIHKRVSERGGKLELRNLDKNLHKLFEITQLTKIFNIT
jgi:anti-sigma B factor antagonist